MQKVIGLAGHIDHGKTALVKALTGVDTDRLEEEKRRGVTIDIGIAFYSEELTFIDVPGHEKFIKNMVTGVSTVDGAILVIAADDGIMPQTIEHLHILQLLGVRNLIVALNKIDLVESEWKLLLRDEIREFLEAQGYSQTPIIDVSATQGTGIDTLRGQIDELLSRLHPRDQQGLFRLPIDRVFSVKGFGTVVTGTVMSHELHPSQKVELYPQQKIFQVRGLQSHNRDVTKISFGDRGAINLGGASVQELGRGAFLGSPGMFQTGDTWLLRLNVLQDWKRSVKEADRVHVHVGTGKREARIHLLEANQCRPGDSMLAQLFFTEKVSAAFGERVVIRFRSPENTLGGGILFWSIDYRLKKGDKHLSHLDGLESAELSEAIDRLFRFFDQPLTRREIARFLSHSESKIQASLDKIRTLVYKDKYLPLTRYEPLLKDIEEKLSLYHAQNPLGKGLPASDLLEGQDLIRDFILEAELEMGHLRNQGNLWQSGEHRAELTQSEETLQRELTAAMEEANYSSPTLEELSRRFGEASKSMLDWMIRNGKLVRIEKEFYILDTQWDRFQRTLQDWFRTHEELSIGELREIIPSSRKYLLPLLNYAERKGFLIRDGDIRRWIGEEL